jgi:hypothetical protein
MVDVPAFTEEQERAIAGLLRDALSDALTRRDAAQADLEQRIQNAEARIAALEKEMTDKAAKGDTHGRSQGFARGSR